MKKIIMALTLGISMMVSSIGLSYQLDLEWKALEDINIKTEILDTGISPDEKILFILSRGELLVYSIGEGRTINRIPLEQEFVKLNYLPKINALVLSTTSKKDLRIIMLEFIKNFDLAELPYQGPINAPVTIVVFNDYQ